MGEVTPLSENRALSPIDDPHVTTSELQKKCYEMRLKGWTYKDIGVELGIVAATASKYVRKYTDTITSRQEMLDLRDEHMAKYSHIIREHMGKVGQSESAAYLVMTAMQRIEKLYGVQEAAKVHLHTTGNVQHTGSVAFEQSEKDELAQILSDLNKRKEEDLDIVEGQIVD